jgi:ubiquinone/menaquinone biosynthesis C-methylase UbiE
LLRDPENIESNFIRNTLGPAAGTVLEIGCGDGRLTAELLSISDTILALDPDPDSIGKARHLLGRGVKLILGSGEDIPLPDDSFDTAVFSLSLHHQDPVKALEEARRVVSPGGRILILEPVEHSIITMLFALLHDESRKYERAEVAIAGASLKELRSGSFRFLWMFEDFHEMAGYLFDYYSMEPDLVKKDRMAKLLGNRRHSKPLGIEDITRYWLLQDDLYGNQASAR